MVKNGRRRGIQCHLCKDCGRQQVVRTTERGIPTHVVPFLERALHERNSLRSLGRIFNVALTTVANFARKYLAQSPADLNFVPHAQTDLSRDDIEIDEMHTFVGNKKQRRWIWIVLHRQTRQVLAFVIGTRGSATLRKLWVKLQELGCKGLVHTDGWRAYGEVIPAQQLVQHVDRGGTNRVEGLNVRWRQRIASLVRKTLSDAKKTECLHERMQAAFAQWNLSLL